MTSTSILLAKVGASATGVAVVGGTSYVVVQNSTSIQNFFTSDKSTVTDNEVPTNNLEVPNKPAKETEASVVANQTPTITTQDSTNYVYMVAKFSNDGQNASTDLYDSSAQEYICQFTKNDNSVVKNTTCKIYKLAATSSTSTLINLKDSALSSNSSEVKNKSELTNGSEYLLKLSDTFVTDLSGASKTEIKIIHKTATTTNLYGTFTKSVDLSKETQKITPTGAQSNLFAAIITTKGTSITIDENSTYKCKIGTSAAVECKVYKLADDYANKSKTELETSVGKLTESDLGVNKHVLIELSTSQTTLADLDGKIVVLQNKEGETTVAEVLADQLLVGSASATTPSSSNLFIVSDSYSTLTEGTVSGSEKAYILTKGSATKTLPKNPTYSASDYLCRVIAESKTFDDAECKLYEFPKANEASFDFDHYKSSTGSAISDINKLAVNKYQIVELKQALQTELKKAGATLHLVKTDRKEKTINNKLVDLTKELDITTSAADTTALKTNLFLVRYTGTSPSTVATITQDATLTCSEGSTSLGACKIYKFGENTKNDNTFTNVEVAALTPVTSPQTSFTTNSFLAIELTTERKSFDELKNKTITLKQSNSDIGSFAFDQIIIGKAGVAGLPDKPTLVSYIVKKTVGWTDVASATSYRCKFPAVSSSSNIDNYDSSCKLVSVAPTGENKIMAFETLKTAATKIEASDLNSKTETHYKLIVNSKLLSNLSFDEDTSAAVQVELIKNDGTSAATFDITQKLNNTAFTGKTNLLLAQVAKAEGKVNGTLTEAKCNYDESSTVVDENTFACSLHKGNIADGVTDLLKTTFSNEPITATDTFAEKEYYLIDLTVPQKLSELGAKTKLFYQIPDSSASDGTSNRNIELTILCLMSGDFKNNQQPMFIKETIVPAK